MRAARFVVPCEELQLAFNDAVEDPPQQGAADDLIPQLHPDRVFDPLGVELILPGLLQLNLERCVAVHEHGQDDVDQDEEDDEHKHEVEDKGHHARALDQVVARVLCMAIHTAHFTGQSSRAGCKLEQCL
eukprot:scaffold120471_cov51-Prasinocladus_malaysianus.AAC.1